jgi:hypothetical protein
VPYTVDIATAPEPDDVFAYPENPLIESDSGYVRNGRYYLPDPDLGLYKNGKPKPRICTRATTWAKTTADTFTLNQWQIRMVLKGLAMSPSLIMRVAKVMNDHLPPGEEKAELQPIAEDAKTVAAAREPAEQGTGMHALAEQIDSGIELEVIPEPWDRDLVAYQNILLKEGLSPIPEYIERIVLCKRYDVAGKYDRILRMSTPCPECGSSLAIGDLKTGRDLQYGWNEISIQLALYAHADLMLDYATDTFEPMPVVCLHTAYVMHVPVGKGLATLYKVDVEAGWAGSELVRMIRDWRGRKDLAEPVQMMEVSGDAKGGYVVLNHFMTYEDRIDLAPTVGELRAIWREARRAKRWTPELEARSKDRQKVLELG